MSEGINLDGLNYSDIHNSICEAVREGNFSSMLAFIEEYTDDNCGSGNLHIVLDDGNLEEGCLDWARGYCDGKDDKCGSSICTFLSFLPLGIRETLYNDNWEIL